MIWRVCENMANVLCVQVPGTASRDGFQQREDGLRIKVGVTSVFA